MNNLLKGLLLGVLLSLFFTSKSTAQHSVVYTNIIDADSGSYTLRVYKQLDDSTFIYRTKQFNKQTMVGLDSGYYVFCYYDQNSLMFFGNDILIGREPLVSVFNILHKPSSLQTFDFANCILVSAGMFELTVRREIYIEF